MRAAEVAEVLGVHVQTVYRLVRAGRFPGAYVIGQGAVRPRGLRIPSTAVDALLDAARIPATDLAS
jgi:excisionase family DNA binding protein